MVEERSKLAPHYRAVSGGDAIRVGVRACKTPTPGVRGMYVCVGGYGWECFANTNVRRLLHRVYARSLTHRARQ